MTWAEAFSNNADAIMGGIAVMVFFIFYFRHRD